MDDFIQPVTVVLEHPIEMGESRIVDVTFKRRATMRDMQYMPVQNATMGDWMRAACRLAGLAPDVGLRMEVTDATRVIEAAMPFFGTSPATGGN